MVKFLFTPYKCSEKLDCQIVGKGDAVKKLKTSLKIPRFYIMPGCLAACPTTSFDHLLVDAQ